ncbi:MAG: transcription termination/antitermination protein NusA [Bacillota bacterium]|nr:transcription termination/antitermination protein NusA [Bacillota bacterium]MDK2855531.1 transcription termination/antitermination protein NusA [Bacillota bacterium]MDK2925470.1 transcription termination/antitermination protein NusA [Bacillota bacterium]
MNQEFLEALDQLEKERGIKKEVLLEALEAALVSAYKKNFSSAQNVRVQIDRTTGEVKVFARKVVVDKVEDPRLEVSLEEAKEIDPRYEIEDIMEFEVTPREFGRIAAQNAKQVVVQRIREAERGIIYEEFADREGDIITGVIQKFEQKNVLLDLGRAEAILAASEQMPNDVYRPGERLKAYVLEVNRTTKGPQILVSRTHPGFLKRLFELEVPEIHDGTVEIKSIAREAGSRSKMAVWARDPNVDPVGACVGPKGMRVQAVVNELRGEKIDIIKWSSVPEEFIASALSPARVLGVTLEEEGRVARVRVPENQLSLAIGKEGQNARLAAKLTGWKIDIKSEPQGAGEVKESDAP